jgi:excisionase family DNA binding protein
MDEETFYTIPEAAKKLRVTRAALYKWMKNGRLKFVVVGSERRITGSALTAFIKAGNEIPGNDKMDTQIHRLVTEAA